MTQAENFTQYASNVDDFPQVLENEEQVENLISRLQDELYAETDVPNITHMPLALPDRQISTIVLEFEDGSVVDPHEMKAYPTIYDAKMAALGQFSDLSETMDFEGMDADGPASLDGLS